MSLMLHYMFKKLGIGDSKPTSISFHLNCSVKYLVGILEDILIHVGKFFVPIDFVVIEMDEDEKIPIIVGKSFLTTIGVLIDVKNNKLTLSISDNIIEFDILKNNKEHLTAKPSCGSDMKSTYSKVKIQNPRTLI